MKNIIYILALPLVCSCNNNFNSIKKAKNKIDTLNINHSTLFDTTVNFSTNIGKKFNKNDFNKNKLKNDKNLDCYVSFKGRFKKHANKIEVEIEDYNKIHQVKKLNNYHFKILKSLSDTLGSLQLEFFIKPKRGYVIKYQENSNSKEIEYYNYKEKMNLFIWTNKMEKSIKKK
jgi:hypothetical protein